MDTVELAFINAKWVCRLYRGSKGWTRFVDHFLV